MREIVLAQRDQDPVVLAREVEPLDDGLVVLHPRFERLGRAVLDEIREVLEKLRGALAAEVVALREREDLLELVEDQQRNERLARCVAEHVAAMVEELPQRFAVDRHAGLRPLARGFGRAEDRLLDLLGGLGRLRRIIEPNVDRAIALGPQPRHDPRAQDRRLAETRLAEQDREELALNAARELGDLLLAAVEVAARLLGERREAEPRMLRVDCGVRGRAVRRRGGGVGAHAGSGIRRGPSVRRRHARLRLRGRRCHPLRAASRSLSRRANSGVTSPPGSRVKCTALNLSGTCASPPFVSSIVTGMMKSAPSAMLRARSIA